MAPLPDPVRAAVEDVSRLEVLAELDATDTGPDSDFDRITRLAARLFGARIAFVTLLDDKMQWFKSSFGTPDPGPSPVEISFCAHAIADADADHMLVPDMRRDPRFADNPYVLGPPAARFYASAPITVRGQRIGTLCILDPEPRAEIGTEPIRQLVDLAALGATLFELKDEARVRARTAAKLMREEWRHALTLEAGQVGSWVWDLATGEVACNDTFRRMFDLPEAGVLTMDRVLDAIHRADRPIVQRALDAAIERGVDFAAEMRVSTPEERWLTTRGRVYQRDAAGNPLVMMGASLDVTPERRAAEHTRLLLRELNHRVKNTLAMIQSVARQTIRQNPDPQDFITAFSGRLRTLSDTHVLLADRDWEGVQLYDVIASQLGTQFLASPERARVSGPDLMLPADHALGLGLILHELSTNAQLHGAWSTGTGEVDVHWEIHESPARGLAVSWKETGGPPVSTPEEYGLGIRLIERSLSKVLDSEVKLTFEPDGVRADLWIPLPREAG